MYKSIVYQGDKPIGEVEVYPQNKDYYYYLSENNSNNNKNNNKNRNYENNYYKELRISCFSQASERCWPLAVLYYICCSKMELNGNKGGFCLKMESKTLSKELHFLHSSCIRDKKTAVVLLEADELHLVAMPSRKDDGRSQYFWGFRVAPGLYSSCLIMLNLRCLGIVFDLDETLVVANTMRSFEDRIEALQRKLINEVDPQRINGMLAEIKRYQDDKVILKQYAENDQVVENGRVVKSQSEVVPALSNSHPSIVRPIVRLQDKNMILTRINPLIRDTSVLVRLRPAWEDLRSYLMARGRKRFEVFVCTMAERDYALEMWRLLDPDSNLINSKELLDRLVCVKSGSKKSLFNVFQQGNCHPKMSLVIDDRLKVWEEEDQPRVHVVPAFAPYYAPQAEANNAIPVLCVARNVACNVRGGFFKDFDDGMLLRISELMYEDDIKDLPSTPDVSNYLISEDDVSTLNANKEAAVGSDGMADAEVEKRLKEAVPVPPAVPLVVVNNQDPRFAHLQYAIAPPPIPAPPSAFQSPVVPFPVQPLPLPVQPLPPLPPLPQMTSLVKPIGLVGPTEANLHSSPAREEGEVPESELDPDTRRRLLILQHGMEPQIPVRPPLQVPVPHVQTRGNWPQAEEQMSPGLRNRNSTQPQEFPLKSETMHVEQQRQHPPPFLRKMSNLMVPDRHLENHRFLQEALPRDDRMRQNYPMQGYHSFPGAEMPLGPSSSSARNHEIKPVRLDLRETPSGALQDIAGRCGTKVEFRSAMVPSMELQFSIEVWFAGEKVGEAIGRTRREARNQASEVSLMNLADKFLSRFKPDSVSLHGEGSRFSNANENGFAGDASSFGHQSSYNKESPSVSSAPEPPVVPDPPIVQDPLLEGSIKSMGSITSLEELCTKEGLGVAFSQPPPSDNPIPKDEVYAQVEVDGHVMGTGTGLTWDEAKMQAAEKALENLKNMLGHFFEKRPGSPRESEGMPNKRPKSEYQKAFQQMPSSRYPKNASPGQCVPDSAFCRVWPTLVTKSDFGAVAWCGKLNAIACASETCARIPSSNANTPFWIPIHIVNPERPTECAVFNVIADSPRDSVQFMKWSPTSCPRALLIANFHGRITIWTQPSQGPPHLVRDASCWQREHEWRQDIAVVTKWLSGLSPYRWLSSRSSNSVTSKSTLEEKFLSQEPQSSAGWPNFMCVCSVFSSGSVQLHWAQWPPNQNSSAKWYCTSKGLLGAGPSGIMAADAIITDSGAMHVAGVPIVNPSTVVVWEVTPGPGNGFYVTPKASTSAGIPPSLAPPCWDGFAPLAAYLLSWQEYFLSEVKQGKKHTDQDYSDMVSLHCSPVSNFSAYVSPETAAQSATTTTWGSGVTAVAFDPTYGGSVIAVVIVEGQYMSPYDPDEGPSITGWRVQRWESSLKPVVLHQIFGNPTSSFGGQAPMQTVWVTTVNKCISPTNDFKIHQTAAVGPNSDLINASDSGMEKTKWVCFDPFDLPSDVRSLARIVYSAHGGEIAVVFLRGGVHIFTGASFAPVDNYQINVGSAIATPAFSSTSCCLASVWHNSSKDCTILKIVRVLPPAVPSSQVKANSSTWERAIAERFWWSLLVGVDWWDAVGCTQSAAEDGIVSLNSVIAVLDSDFHSLSSTQHRQQYSPSLDRIKCRLLEGTNAQEVRAIVLDMQARLLLDMLGKGIESALINRSALVSEPWQETGERLSSIDPESMAIEPALVPIIQAYVDSVLDLASHFITRLRRYASFCRTLANHAVTNGTSSNRNMVASPTQNTASSATNQGGQGGTATSTGSTQMQAWVQGAIAKISSTADGVPSSAPSPVNGPSSFNMPISINTGTFPGTPAVRLIGDCNFLHRLCQLLLFCFFFRRGMPRFVGAQRNTDTNIQKPQPGVAAKVEEMNSFPTKLISNQPSSGTKGPEESLASRSRLGSGNAGQGYTFEEVKVLFLIVMDLCRRTSGLAHPLPTSLVGSNNIPVRLHFIDGNYTVLPEVVEAALGPHMQVACIPFQKN